MATYYVDDSKTSGADDGSSWDDSFLSIYSAASAASTGDLVLVASTHDQDITGSGDITWNDGTWSQPVTIVSTASGTNTYTPGATLRGMSTSADFQVGTNDHIAVWGLEFIAGAAGADIRAGYGNDGSSYYYGCTFTAEDRIYLVGGTDHAAQHTSCEYNITGLSGFRELYQTGTRSSVVVRDGDINNTHKPHAVRLEYGSGTVLRACDLSDFEHGILNTSTSNSTIQARISGCAVGTGYTTATTAYTSKAGNTISTDYSAAGTITSPINGMVGAADVGGETQIDTTRYRAGGAVDSLTGDSYCHQLTCRYGSENDGHRSIEIVGRVDGGSEVTATVCLAASTSLTDEEFWIDWFCPSEGSTARQHFASSRKANPLATAAALTSDTSSWTGSGLTSKFKVSLTWTPAVGGLIFAEPVFAKSGSTVYLDPKITVS